MSHIERWWLIVGPDGHAFEVRDEQPDPILGHGQPFKDRVIEVASAEQLRGAVDELGRLRGLVDAMLDGSDDDHYAAIRALRADRNARRGQ